MFFFLEEDVTVVMDGIDIGYVGFNMRSWSYILAEHHGEVNLPIPENLVITWPCTAHPFVFVNKNCCLCKCVIEFFYWSLVVSLAILMHLSAAIPRGSGGVTPGNLRIFGHLHNDVYKSGSYPKPKLFNKKLLTPLPWGQRSVFCQVKRWNVSKEFYFP